MILSERSLAIEKQTIVRAKQQALNNTSWFTWAELAKAISVSSPDVGIQLRAWEKRK